VLAAADVKGREMSPPEPRVTVRRPMVSPKPALGPLPEQDAQQQ